MGFVISLLLSISEKSVMSAGMFIGLNAATVALLCTLYLTYLYFLVRKRIRTGAYGADAFQK